MLNNMEDEYVGGLTFSQGADMCSLQKTVCRGISTVVLIETEYFIV